MMRIGFSRDIHRLENNSRPLIICGVKLDFDKGPVSHSDGDCVYHAVAESILGAIAKGDLGTLFPDNDMQYKDMDSEIILLTAYKLMDEMGYRINNVDVNIVLERPKLKPHILAMRENLARILHLDLSAVSIKAQTNEKCGEIGRGEAYESTSIVLLIRK